jgi:alpha-ribazole phosphatase
MSGTSDETRLWLIRHAPVNGPRGVIHEFDAPADLSSYVKLERLSELLPRDATSVCSPARRTRETATALGLFPQNDPAFREQNFGRWTGRRHADISAEEGAGYAAFWQRPAENRPPGGESFADQVARVETGLAALPAGDVILVVHSGTIRAVLAIALGIAPEKALRFVIDPISLTRVDRLNSGWRIVAVNRA